MYIRIFIFVIILFFNGNTALSQETKGYYFNDFTQGQVILKNKQFARGKFNYDFVNRQMHFLNGKVDMIVENLEDIDTIIINQTRFIPYNDRFLEVVKGENTVMLIEKNITTREYGKVGAMGVATHGSVQTIDVNARFQRVNGDNNTDITVYKDDIEHTYFILNKRSWKPFSNQATLLKLFPKKYHEKIKKTINDYNVDFDNPEDVLKLLEIINS